MSDISASTSTEGAPASTTEGAPATAAPAAPAKDPAAERQAGVDRARLIELGRKSKEARSLKEKFGPIADAVAQRGLDPAKLVSAIQRSGEDPLAVLELLGVSVEDILERHVGISRQLSPEERVEALEKQIREKDESAKREADESSKRQKAEETEQAIAQHIDGIKAVATGDASRFPLVNAEEAYEEAFDVMVYAHQSGHKVTYEQALLALEEQYAEKFDKFSKAKAPTSQQGAVNDTRTAATPRTLTNSMTSEVPARAPGDIKSDDEIRRAGVALFGA